MSENLADLPWDQASGLWYPWKSQALVVMTGSASARLAKDVQA